jgi:hypothetical protein
MKHYKKFWFFVLAPIVLVGLAGYVGRDFVMEAIARNPQLNLSILLVIVCSVILVLSIQRSYWHDARTLVRFHKIYQQKHDLQQAGDAVAADKSKIAEVLKLAVRMGGRHERNAIEPQVLSEEINHLKENYASRVSLPHFLSGFMVALGLFGTFIGLLETLTSTSDLLTRFSGGNIADMGQAVSGILSGMRAPLGGMATSFSASLFGLLGSLVVGLMLNSIEGMSYRILQELRSVVDEIVAEAGARQGTQQSKNAPSTEFLQAFLERILMQQQRAADLFDESRQADAQSQRQLLQIAGHIGETATVLERVTQTLAATQEIASSLLKNNQFLVAQIDRQTLLIDAIARQASSTQMQTQSCESILTQIRDAAENLASTQQMIVKVGHHESNKHAAFLEAGMQSMGTFHKSTMTTQLQLQATLGELRQLMGLERESDKTAIARIDAQLTQSNALLEKIVAGAAKPGGDAHELSIHVQTFALELKRNRELLTRDLSAEIRELSRTSVAQINHPLQ